MSDRREPYLDNDKLLRLAETSRPPQRWYDENFADYDESAEQPVSGRQVIEYAIIVVMVALVLAVFWSSWIPFPGAK